MPPILRETCFASLGESTDSKRNLSFLTAQGRLEDQQYKEATQTTRTMNVGTTEMENRGTCLGDAEQTWLCL